MMKIALSIFCSILVGCLAARADDGVLGRQDVPVTRSVAVNVPFKGEFKNGPSTAASMFQGWFQAGGTSFYTYLPANQTQMWRETGEGLASLVPGKDYTFQVFGNTVNGFKVHFAPPPGYRVFVENVERFVYNATTVQLQYSYIYFKVRIVEVVDAAVDLNPGVATSIMAGDQPGSFVWQVGLGRLKNNKPAGALSIKGSAISSSTVTPAGLIYATDSAEVEVITDSNGMRQVYANHALADITKISNWKFSIRYFQRSQVGAKVNGEYQLSGNPYVTYEVEDPGSGTLSSIKITRTIGAKSWVTQLTNPTTTWSLEDWHEGATIPRRENRPITGGGLTETVSVLDQNGVVATQFTNTFVSQWNRKDLASRVTTVGSLTTSLAYHTDSARPGNFRRLKSLQGPDGSWIQTEYYDDLARLGRLYRTYQPFKDSPSSPPTLGSTGSGVVTTFDYTADWTGRRSLPSSVEVRTDNVVTAKSIYGYSNTSINYKGITLPIVAETRSDFASASASLNVVTKRFREDADPGAHFFPGLIWSVTRPGGLRESHAYIEGYFMPSYMSFTPVVGGPERMEVIWFGIEGGAGTTVSNYGPSDQIFDVDDVVLVANKSRMRQVVRSTLGSVIYKADYLYTGSGYVLLEGVYGSFDAFGQQLSVTKVYAANTITGVTYADVYNATVQDGQIQSETDETGNVRTFGYDAAGRIQRVTIAGVAASGTYAAQNDVVVDYQYDAAGRIRRVERSPSPGPGPGVESIVHQYNYDSAGRLTSKSSPGQNGPVSTTFEYPAYNQTRTVYADLGVRLETRHRDGRTQSVTGDAQSPEYYSYTVESNGYISTVSALNATLTDGWTGEKVDWLGRLAESAGPTSEYTSSNQKKWRDVRSYGANGKQNKREVLDETGAILLAPFVTEYDDHGEIAATGLDLGGALGLDRSGVGARDYVVEYNPGFVLDDGAYWVRSDPQVYVADEASSTASLGKRLQQVSHFSATLRARSKLVDGNANVTIESSNLDRSARLLTTERTVPGASNLARSVTRNGLTVLETSVEGVSVAYSYDSLRRVNKVKRRDIVEDTITYYSGTELPWKHRNYFFDTKILSYDNMGRVVQTTDAEGRSVRFAYDKMGQPTSRWGDGDLPLKMQYNTYGWMEYFWTFQDNPISGSWADPQWPISPGTGQRTQRHYHPPTGMVDWTSNARDETTTFKYNSRGQLIERILPTTESVIYGYFDSASDCTGRLKSVSFKRNGISTPSESYAYYRHGSIKTVQDASGSRQFAYRGDLQLDSETLGSLYGGKVIDYAYSTSGVPGRLESISFDSSSVYKTGFTYESTTGRLGTVGFDPIAETFTYGYHANANLIDSVTGGTGFSRTTHWQSWRDMDDVIETKWNTSVKAGFVYDTNWAGRRTTQKPASGAAWSIAMGYPEGAVTDYTYTTRGELETTDTHKYVSGVLQPVSGRLRKWTYDSAGNWKKDSRTLADPPSSSDATSFVPDATNRYTSITGMEPRNEATDSAGNRSFDDKWIYRYDAKNRLVGMRNQVGQPTKILNFVYDFRDRRISKEVYESQTGLFAEYFNNIDLAGSPALTRVDTNIDFDWAGGSPGAGVNASNISVRWHGVVTVASTGNWTFSTESDDGVRLWVNGCLLVDNWTNHGATVDSGSIYLEASQFYDIRMEWFQGGGGSVAKLRWTGPGVSNSVIPNSAFRAPVSSTVFAYNGEHMIAEMDGKAGRNMTRSYVWGMDRSQTYGGAGGVGGLLLIRQGTTSLYPAYDCMGNVVALVDGSGALRAAYEYSPYGRLLNSSGDLAASNPFRYSTKYTDLETGLVDFGRRFYDPVVGRFVNSDPIGESGGLNLYAIAENDPINKYDYLGMAVQQYLEYVGSYYTWQIVGYSPGFYSDGYWWGGSYIWALIRVDVYRWREREIPDPEFGAVPSEADTSVRPEDVVITGLRDPSPTISVAANSETYQVAAATRERSVTETYEDGTQEVFVFDDHDKLVRREWIVPKTWDPKTDAAITKLHPLIRAKVAAFINRVEKELGIRLRVGQGMRTIAEQDALYAQGRTAPGRRVTNARGGSSYHNFGLAVDVYDVSGGKINDIPPAVMAKIAKIGKEMGFEWGGDFKSIVDTPHFQVTFGQSVGELKALHDAGTVDTGGFVEIPGTQRAVPQPPPNPNPPAG